LWALQQLSQWTLSRHLPQCKIGADLTPLQALADTASAGFQVMAVSVNRSPKSPFAPAGTGWRRADTDDFDVFGAMVTGDHLPAIVGV